MADIRPFHGLRYDTTRVALPDVVCPPYDVITPAAADTLRRRSPYNAVHIELPVSPTGDPGERYAAAAGLLDAWRTAGVLRSDDELSLYLVTQRFPGADGRGQSGSESEPKKSAFPVFHQGFSVGQIILGKTNFNRNN